MVTVLRRLGASKLLEEFPGLSAFVARGEARPAYKRCRANAIFRESFLAASAGWLTRRVVQHRVPKLHAECLIGGAFAVW